MEKLKTNRESLLPPHGLPIPQKKAYFPQQPDSGNTKDWLNNWALERTGNGENLVAVIGYGSQADGSSSADSMHDYILVVDDLKKFHKDNLRFGGDGRHLTDYGFPPRPHSSRLQSKVHGLGFHYAKTQGESEKDIKIKYSVISLDNFEKGCHGTLPDRDCEGRGAFGMYVAGRIQKVALNRTHWPQDQKVQERLETAINKARIDGVWLSLGTVGERFTVEELAGQYVSLSYRADKRIEDPKKVDKIQSNNYREYNTMLTGLLEQFAAVGIVSFDENTSMWTKNASPPAQALNERLRELKRMTTLKNFSNIITAGFWSGVAYEYRKVKRVREKKKNSQT